MNYFVPDFEMEDDDSIPISSRFARHKNYTLPDQDELVELLWENGKIVMQSQNQRSLKKSSLKFLIDDDAIPAGQSTATEFKSAAAAAEEDAAHQLFMQEDEMASWLHYPLDGDFSADLLYPTPSGHCASPCRSNLIQEDRRPEENPPVASRPPVPEVRRTELDSASTKFHNFMHFSLPKVRIASGPSTSDKAARDSTVVDSNETPAAGSGSLVSHVGRSTSTTPVSDVNYGCGSMSGDAAAVDAVRDLTTSELAMMSSSGGSGASVSVTAEPLLKAPADNRKRKAREAEYSECHSEDAEFESVDTRKQVCGSASTRRTRAAEVHNLSERKRRDRINEKMKALQELIPHCNKSDKASMLDEAIEYLKSLQLQVQMMSMGCSMVPMMFPCVQPYISPMGMGMGMEMGLSQPMLSYPSVFAGSSMPTPAAASHLGLRVPMPAIHVQPVPTADLSRIKATNQFDRTLNSIGRPSPNQPQIPNFADPCQHYLGLQQMQVPPPQSRAMAQPINNKGVETLENHQSVRPIDKHKQGH